VRRPIRTTIAFQSIIVYFTADRVLFKF